MFRKFQKPKPVKKNCPFCKSAKGETSPLRGGEEPDYKNYQQLRAYTSERGRIFARTRTGLCAKHQHRVDQQIKRARHLAYLPFVEGI